MTARDRLRGFTLLEVLVALALVATALGGTLMVVREALRTQQYLERRLFAQWVADNAINQFILETQGGREVEQRGREVMLGRVYDYAIDVRPLVDEREPDAAQLSADGAAEAGDPGAAGEPAPALSEVAVEVRDAESRRDPLARRVRRVALEGGA